MDLVLQPETSVIRAQCNAERTGGRDRRRSHGRRLIRLIHKLQERRKRLLNLIAAGKVNIDPLPDRIRNIHGVERAGLEKFTKQKRLLSCPREKHQNGVHMAAGHREDECRLFREIFRQRLASVTRDIDSPRTQNFDRVNARRLTVDCAHAGRADLNILAVAHHVAEQALSHRAPADITGADKKDMLRCGHEKGMWI